MEFKGIIEHYQFIKLSNEEREKFLIEKKIFVKSDRPLQYLFDADELYNHYTYDVSKIFANNLETSKGVLTLNSILLDAVTEEIKNQCRERFETLFGREEIFRVQFYAYPVEEFIEIKKSIMKSNAQCLHDKLYFELNKVDFKNFELHTSIINTFVKYDHKFIYDFLNGFDNKSSYFQHNYHQFITNNIYLSLFEEIEEFNSIVSTVKGSRPKRIALMHELGMLSSEKFNNLSIPKKVKVLAYILNEELIGDRKNNYRKNLTSLNPNSTMDPKGMASNHMHTILKEVLNS